MGDVVLRAHLLIHNILLLTEVLEVLTEANHLHTHLRTDTLAGATRLIRTEEVLIPAGHSQEQEQEENIFILILL